MSFINVFLSWAGMGYRIENGIYEKDSTVLELGGCLGVLSTILNKKLAKPRIDRYNYI